MSPFKLSINCLQIKWIRQSIPVGLNLFCLSTLENNNNIQGNSFILLYIYVVEMLTVGMKLADNRNNFKVMVFKFRNFSSSTELQNLVIFICNYLLWKWTQ